MEDKEVTNQMTQSGGPHTDIQKYAYDHIIDPLRAFRAQVSPLNTNQIDGVSDFATTIAGLLTGSDGELAWQGPASDALANLIGQYLDKEEKLTGSDGTLQGRLLDASTLCEKHATIVEDDIAKFASTGGSSTTADLLDGEPGGENEGGETPEEAVQTEVGIESWSFTSDMQQGPQQAPLQELTQLTPLEAALPPADNPLSENLPADNPQTSTLGLTPEQEQMAEDLANETGADLGRIRQIIKANSRYPLSSEEYQLLVEYDQKYGRYPYNVRAIFPGEDIDGNTSTYYLDDGAFKKVPTHPDPLQNLSDDELTAEVQDLLEGPPDKQVPKPSKGYVDYLYYDVYVDPPGHYITVDIRISTTSPGRIISVYGIWDQ
jgi:hypothetical protein